MGNCHAAEAAAVLIQHPGKKIERIYGSQSASKVMASNPGHYVAVIITVHSPYGNLAGASDPVKHLKLLRPDDTLHIGHVYRLVSFEEILREFALKKRVRLSRFVNVVKEKRRSRVTRGGGDFSALDMDAVTGGKMGGEAVTPPPRMRQWRPALQSIEEVVDFT